MQKKPSTPLIIAGVVGIVVLILALGGFFLFKKVMSPSTATPTPTPVKKKINKPVNLIPFEERPFVIMAPTAGREVDVTVVTLPKAADSVDYLSEYQHGTSLGGNEQFIDLKKGLPATKQFALYSRSAGGKTSYEEDVKGGSLTLNFGGAEAYALKQDWKYFDNQTKSQQFQTADEKFGILGKDLAPLRYVILYNSPGAPAPIPGKRLSEVYTVQASSPLKGLHADITIQMSEVGGGKLMGWDGKAWKQLESTIAEDNLVVGTNVELMEAYVVAE